MSTFPTPAELISSSKVSAVYDFSATGPGTFTFNPVSTFQVAGLNDVVEAISDTAHPNIVNAGSVSITVTNDVSKLKLHLEKRAEVSCSNSSQASFISASYSESKSLAAQAASHISSRGAGDPIYKAYFGTNPTSTIISTFTAIANENSSTRILSCTDIYGICSPGVIAYTDTTTSNVYYCGIFYDEVASDTLCHGNPVDARNIRGGTTLHELTHALVDTDDIVYGCPIDQTLSDNGMRINADNYNVGAQTSCRFPEAGVLTCGLRLLQCFASQVYASTQC